jgi:hypothetical protein
VQLRPSPPNLNKLDKGVKIMEILTAHLIEILTGIIIALLTLAYNALRKYLNEKTSIDIGQELMEEFVLALNYGKKHAIELVGDKVDSIEFENELLNKATE